MAYPMTVTDGQLPDSTVSAENKDSQHSLTTFVCILLAFCPAWLRRGAETTGIVVDEGVLFC